MMGTLSMNPFDWASLDLRSSMILPYWTTHVVFTECILLEMMRRPSPQWPHDEFMFVADTHLQYNLVDFSVILRTVLIRGGERWYIWTAQCALIQHSKRPVISR
jgi:hypothetical protein